VSAVALAAAEPLVPVACEGEGTGTIRGRVVDDSTSAPVSGAWIYLSSNCRTTSDDLGRFAFTNVPRTRVTVDLGSAGYRDIRRNAIPVNEPGDTASVELRLRAGGPLEDCRVIPGCAPLLTANRGALTDEEDFRVSAYGAAIAMLLPNVGLVRHVCVDDEEKVRTALAARYRPIVVPSEECGRIPSPPPPAAPVRRYVHLASGEDAVSIGVSNVKDTAPDRRTALVAGGYLGSECRFERLANGWRPVLCVVQVQF
jgi:hypothetical protein